MKLYHKFLFPAIFLAFTFSSVAQQQGSMWKDLGKVAYKKEYNELLGFKVDVPVFSPEVKELEGEWIVLRGFIIPTEGYKSHTEFVFSAFPYNMCFFCGGAGPETVIEVEASEPVKFTTDAVFIKGKLVLNQRDLNRLMYRLLDARQIPEPTQ